MIQRKYVNACMRREGGLIHLQRCPERTGSKILKGKKGEKKKKGPNYKNKDKCVFMDDDRRYAETIVFIRILCIHSPIVVSRMKLSITPTKVLWEHLQRHPDHEARLDIYLFIQ